ncbi:MAG TPA: hypothetical protein P5228_11095 [Bacteroidales bacterium]|nr:hypothetical protein [Bacteroidales bacterium]HRZ49354.1 hypothetical protein [Bacteroidales bacterium]
MHYTLNAPYIVHETIDGETIVMNLKNGFYYSFTGIGPAIWELIMAGASHDQIRTIMSQSFGSLMPDFEEVLNSFITELKTNEIILESQEPLFTHTDAGLKSLASSDLFAPETAKPPVFHRYTDMQDVLLLDPIHDVDEKGWPEPKTPRK